MVYIISVNKDDVVRIVCRKTNYRASVIEDVINETLDSIIAYMEDGITVRFSGFGVFEPKQRAARIGRNPHSGEPVPIPARTVPVFRPGENMKKAVIKEDKENNL